MNFIKIALFFSSLIANAQVKDFMIGKEINTKEMYIDAIRQHWTFEIQDNAISRATGFDYETQQKKHKKIFSYENLSTLEANPPDELDYESLSVAVEDQGRCGSCYDFASTATVADTMKIKGGIDPGRVSFQYGLDCQPSGNYGCNGGTFSVLNAFIDPKGAPSWVDYPYVARQGRCKSLPVKATALEWHYVGASNRMPTDTELMAALDMYGPLVIDIAASNSLIAYKSGIYNACDGRGINHMIQLAGYKKGEYWKIKNSWGSRWGENGYGRLSWKNRSGSMCSKLASTAAFVKVKEQDPPPVVREFSMENDAVSLKITIPKENKLKVDDAKKIIQPFLDKVE